jgi:hypothetical protein
LLSYWCFFSANQEAGILSCSLIGPFWRAKQKSPSPLNLVIFAGPSPTLSTKTPTNHPKNPQLEKIKKKRTLIGAKMNFQISG